MIFNSIDFALFLPLVFCLYWLFNNNLRIQNIILLVSSYYFYASWDWRFLSLIIFSTLVDFYAGVCLSKYKSISLRKFILGLSIMVNLGLLGFFKYYNFFVEQFINAFTLLGQDVSVNSLNIILPVGISFYTFQSMSYTIDVYRKNIVYSSDLICFSSYVSFFPQLVAGPIERASQLLPQFSQKKYFKYPQSVNGMRQILWGLFKKMVIADNCAEIANVLFDYPTQYSSTSLFLGAVFFAFQIYGDFSGYSDIAIGTARLFGFNLMKNFSTPYFSRDIAEFWRRWHISLSSWFRDYLYIPLGGSRVNLKKNIRNVFVVFLVSGLWHGANWTFIVWGAVHAIFFLSLLILKKNRPRLEITDKGSLFPRLSSLIGMATTFLITTMAWVFFRSKSIGEAVIYFKQMFSYKLFSFPEIVKETNVKICLVFLFVFISVEWLGRNHEFAIEKIDQFFGRAMRWAIYAFIIFLLGMYTPTQQIPFIYFQF